MILYHGSTDYVDKPEIRKGKNYLDFGTGFYMTTSFEQAQCWAKIKMRRNNVEIGYVSAYEFDIDKALENCNIKKFESADEEWLTFVVNNRKGEATQEEVDMHIGQLQMIMFIKPFVCLKQGHMMLNILLKD